MFLKLELKTVNEMMKANGIKAKFFKAEGAGGYWVDKLPTSLPEGCENQVALSDGLIINDWEYLSISYEVETGLMVFNMLPF